MVLESVNHPVHVLTKEGSLSPSAFIPFCEFGGKTSAVSTKITKFDVPVCSSFQAKILKDQLCYEVDLNNFSDRSNIKQELKIGFIFIMDYNEDKQVTYEEDFKKTEDDSIAGRIVESDENHHALIYLNTIGIKMFSFLSDFIYCISEPLQLVGEGEYNLNVLKQIKVTNSYLGLNQETKRCQTKESLDNCRTRHYIKSLLGSCSCLPFNIRLSNKVSIQHFYMQTFHNEN